MKNHKIRYPKLLLLILTFIIAATIFYEGETYAPFHDFLVSLGYIGTFVGGIFYAYGFTAAPATAILLVIAKEQNLILAALIGGTGALISDLFIFYFIRHSFIEEVDKLGKERIVINTIKNGKRIFGLSYNYLTPAFAGFLIASPLPTEIGVIMLASLKNVTAKKFMVIAYIMHSIGILIILAIGKSI